MELIGPRCLAPGSVPSAITGWRSSTINRVLLVLLQQTQPTYGTTAEGQRPVDKGNVDFKNVCYDVQESDPARERVEEGGLAFQAEGTW